MKRAEFRGEFLAGSPGRRTAATRGSRNPENSLCSHPQLAGNRKKILERWVEDSASTSLPLRKSLTMLAFRAGRGGQALPTDGQVFLRVPALPCAALAVPCGALRCRAEPDCAVRIVLEAVPDPGGPPRRAPHAALSGAVRTNRPRTRGRTAKISPIPAGNSNFGIFQAGKGKLDATRQHHLKLLHDERHNCIVRNFCFRHNIRKRTTKL